MKTTYALLLTLSLAGALASAQEQTTTPNTSTVKTTEVQKSEEQNKDIDNEITNARMRASSGAKSKWSVKADLTLNGGNLERPFGKDRPNYAGISSQDGKSSLGGTVGVAYRLTEKDSFRLGTGVVLSTPFQDNIKDLGNANGVKKSDVSTPYLEWSHAMRTGSVQNIIGVNYSHATRSYDTDFVKTTGSIDLSHTMVAEIKGSNWQPGLSLDLNDSFFKDGKQDFDTLANQEDGRVDYEVGLYPFVEYAFNDRYSFRTVFRFMTFDHYRSDNAATYLRQLYTQSMGVGIAMTRDIYLYPNLQFAPEHMSPDRTNVGLSTTLNVF